MPLSARLRFSREGQGWVAEGYRIELERPDHTYRRVWRVRHCGAVIGLRPTCRAARLLAQMHANERAAWSAMRPPDGDLSLSRAPGANIASRARRLIRRSQAILARPDR